MTELYIRNRLDQLIEVIKIRSTLYELRDLKKISIKTVYTRLILIMQTPINDEVDTYHDNLLVNYIDNPLIDDICKAITILNKFKDTDYMVTSVIVCDR